MNKIFWLSSFFVFLFIIKIVLVSSQVIDVTRNVPDEINYGDVLEVNISVKNLKEEKIGVTVKELVGNAEPIEPKEFNQTLVHGCKFCIPPKFYLWVFELDGGEMKTIIYKIKPKNIGVYSFSPTIVTTSDNEVYKTIPAKTVVKCNENNICELDLSENFLNCPNDCPSGSEDNVCDLVIDNKCDPDCVGDADIDCVKTKTNLLSSRNIIFIVIAGVLVICIFLLIVVIKNRKSKKWDKLYEKWSG